MIEGIENYPYNEVTIFNRWGDIVRVFDGYDNLNVMWNGTYAANKKIPDGTYYYIIKILYEGQEKYFKGWIYVQGSGN
jgi:gliding motility-associated-like protein